MNELPLNSAFQLYELLAPYLPEVVVGNGIDIIRVMVDNMVASGDGNNYIGALALMNDVDKQTIIDNLPPDECMVEFIRGLELNKFFDLVAFIRAVQHG